LTLQDGGEHGDERQEESGVQDEEDIEEKEIRFV
jgi:hypothetical protein